MNAGNVFQLLSNDARRPGAFTAVDCDDEESHPKYEKMSVVGVGAYGKVYKARRRDRPEMLVALKKIEHTNGEMGFPKSALREIKFLKLCQHKNVIKLLEVVNSRPAKTNDEKGTIFLVFEYMEHDLYSFKRANVRFSLAQIKCILRQTLEGLVYLHSKGIMHRDIKTANLLLNNRGEVKIGDLGLARTANSPTNQYTNKVVTLWYRAPELLMGDTHYSNKIDMWSIGCIMGELLLGDILFKGENREESQMLKICELCGTPNERDWPGLRTMRLRDTILPKVPYARRLRMHLSTLRPDLDANALDLIDKLLAMNPDHRLSAKEALNHSWFTSLPLPVDAPQMPKFQTEYHEYQMIHGSKPSKRMAKVAEKASMPPQILPQIAKQLPPVPMQPMFRTQSAYDSIRQQVTSGQSIDRRPTFAPVPVPSSFNSIAPAQSGPAPLLVPDFLMGSLLTKRKSLN